ncbi:C4-dicarboxylate ABC transporter, partial [Pseudomonas aeruginosa]|nr:C4-dicarboxylate ABC transporter [Pseudomonas aeruginosa]
GKVKVEVYPNSTLFGDADEIEALRGTGWAAWAGVSRLRKSNNEVETADMESPFE